MYKALEALYEAWHCGARVVFGIVDFIARLFLCTLDIRSAVFSGSAAVCRSASSRAASGGTPRIWALDEPHGLQACMCINYKQTN